VPRRRLDRSGNRRRLGQRDVGDVAPEEQPRRLADAVDRERAALTEPHVVEVQLQDLGFRQPPLEDHRHEPFRHLAAQRSFLRQEGVLDELLRERASASGVFAPVEHVAENRRGNGDRIDPRVLVETTVFDREHGVDHVGRDGCQRHVAAFLAAGRDQGGDERRAQGHVGGRRLGSDYLDLLDDGRFGVLGPLAAKRHAHLLILEVSVLGYDQERVTPDGELAAQRCLGTVGVAEVVEAIDELVGGQGLAAMELERPGEHPRVDTLHLPVDARVDHAGEQHVVVTQDRRKDDQRSGEPHQREELPATLAPQARGALFRRLRFLRWGAAGTHRHGSGHACFGGHTSGGRRLVTHLRYRPDRRCA
jgi:hypothetical protein